MSYHFVEISDVLMEEHKLIAENSTYVKSPEDAIKIAMFNAGVNAMAGALIRTINEEEKIEK